MADEVEEEVFVPSGAHQFPVHRGLLIRVHSCDIEGEAAHCCKVLRGVVLAAARRVFEEHGVCRRTS
jgi:hypothetical protein